ncbi:MAG: Y-family DNA polymerase [Candidatus Methylomirabilis sp.]|nr:Y-family DNA polymerase [Deltaproteobacteria bacterium]
MPSSVALVDCNNFYASCERVFEPRLRGRALVVLSNNDGCVISRSPEAKDAGVPMGAPFHEIRDLCKSGLVVRSSNYPLYGDMSGRVMGVLRRFTPRLEVYSIDEAFLELPLVAGADIDAAAAEIVRTVKQWTGLSVSVGVGPTKTLAKLANDWAKDRKTPVAVFTDPYAATRVMDRLDVRCVWGVGRRWGKRLAEEGITTARGLRDANERWIFQKFGVVMERTVMELRGEPCVDLEDAPDRSKSVVSTRSFGRAVLDLDELEEGVAQRAIRAAEKLRARGLLARMVQVSLHSNRHAETEQHASRRFALPEAAEDTGALIRLAVQGARDLYEAGRRYWKVGVYLFDLCAEDAFQPDLFASKARPGVGRLMKTLDRINAEWGQDAVRYAAAGLEQPWRMRSAFRSPRWTTRWEELPTAKA